MSLSRFVIRPAVMALCGIALLVGASPVAAQERTENVERTVRLPANGTVELKNFSGRIRITGSSGNDVVIKAVRRAERPQLDGIKLEIETSGSTVTIDANRRSAGWDDRNENVVNTEFDIQVPASARLRVNAFSSPLEITGVTARMDLKTFSGRIVVTGARDAVVAESFSGDVEIDMAGAGRTPDLEAKTFNGDIRVRLAPNAAGRVEFSTFSGDLQSDLALTLRSSGRRRTSADLPGGSSGETLRLNTFSGDVGLRTGSAGS
jgi:DUF4097 and DUF4098 domain-containing protein YvlB